MQRGSSSRDCRLSQAKEHAKFGLRREDVAPQFREPFILNGYRRPCINAKDCLRSTLSFNCNESFNVWSHFVAFLFFLMKFYCNFSEKHSIRNPFAWPELSFAIGICGFCLMSATAHVFNSISTKVRQVCFYMDYAAISIYSVGAGQAFYFYSRPLREKLPLCGTIECFTVVSVLTSTSSTLICCLSRNRWMKTKYLARTLAFILPFLVNCYPYLYRILFTFSGPDSVTDSFPVFRHHCYLYILSALANATRFPECCFPGKFDFIGASHHYLHVFTAIGAAYQFDAIHTDMLSRKKYLLVSDLQPSGYNTLFPMALAILLNVGISGWFSYQTKQDTEKKSG